MGLEQEEEEESSRWPLKYIVVQQAVYETASKVYGTAGGGQPAVVQWP